MEHLSTKNVYTSVNIHLVVVQMLDFIFTFFCFMIIRISVYIIKLFLRDSRILFCDLIYSEMLFTSPRISPCKSNLNLTVFCYSMETVLCNRCTSINHLYKRQNNFAYHKFSEFNHASECGVCDQGKLVLMN